MLNCTEMFFTVTQCASGSVWSPSFGTHAFLAREYAPTADTVGMLTR